MLWVQEKGEREGRVDVTTLTAVNTNMYEQTKAFEGPEAPLPNIIGGGDNMFLMTGVHNDMFLCGYMFW